MMLYKFLFSFLFLLSTLLVGRYASAQIDSRRRSPLREEEEELRSSNSYSYSSIRKLFVFGDSYADTGNIPKGQGDSWKHPYGITFPGNPTGRFSDGRVLTDYIAKFYGLKSPVPYRLMKYSYMGYKLRYGVNFAYGGTGVFDTSFSYPNMTTQIDFFEKLLDQNVYTKTDFQSSLFLISLVGNDYTTFKTNGGTDEVFPAYALNVVNQFVVNVKRLHELGARKIAITGLPPIGCLPKSTVLFGFQQCNAGEQTAMEIHNLLLAEAVKKLRNENEDSLFVILDLYASFTTAGLYNNIDGFPGKSKFESPLKPCCMGIRDGYACGSVDDKGKKMYTLCEDRESAFFWDGTHPTQAAWRAVYNVLRSTLQFIH